MAEKEKNFAELDEFMAKLEAAGEDETAIEKVFNEGKKAVASELSAVMEDTRFIQSLGETKSYEEFKDAFVAKGVDIENALPDDGSNELSAEELENVAGGLSGNDLVRIVKASYKIIKKGPIRGAWTFGASYGVLIRAYYDVCVHGNVTYSYSEDEIMRAAHAVGLE